MRYILREYLYFLRRRKNLSQNTIKAYQRDLEGYLAHLENYRDLADVTNIKTNDILAYLKTLRNHQLKPITISRKLSSIKGFHQFMFKEHITKEDVSYHIQTPKVDKNLPTVLT
ncbi:MAG: site-specific integrase, partial [Acholeplasmataceae bacterium]